MRVIHANWSAGYLWLWGERVPDAAAPDVSSTPGAASSHPFALSIADMRAAMVTLGVTQDEDHSGLLSIKLPSSPAAPHPSAQMAHWSGMVAHSVGVMEKPALQTWMVPAIAVDPVNAPSVLERLEETGLSTEHHLVDEESGHEYAQASPIEVGSSLRFFAAASRLAQWLLAEERFVPALELDHLGASHGVWRPWLSDKAAAEKLAQLVPAMPASARAVEDAHRHEPWPIIHDFLTSVVDARCRLALARENMAEALDGRDPEVDPHVAWLSGLLGDRNGPVATSTRSGTLARTVGTWLGTLEDRGQGGEWRLCLTLHEPMLASEPSGVATIDNAEWDVTLGLQAIDSPNTLVEAEDIWAWRSTSATIEGRRLDAPHDLLLAELGRASRLWKPLEEALEDPAPVSITLNTTQAYAFLREIRPLLIDQGVGVNVPEWWDTPSARLGSRLKLVAPPTLEEAGWAASAPGSVAPSALGLNALVGYEWSLAIGDTPLTLQEFEKLAAQRAPLVRIAGRWVEIRAEDVQHAIRFIRDNPGGKIRVGEALRMAYGSDQKRTGLPIMGIDASGWIADVLGATSPDGVERMPMLEAPAGFKGELRPYQQRGLSWLAFLDRYGFGPCLADDMGLGKTIQLLALLLNEREQAAASGHTVSPTLLVVPMSIVQNWTREAERFAPTLRVVVHHGTTRLIGDAFFEQAANADLVVTTYALAHRDRTSLERVGWHRVVLDEAQNIKNASAKQSRAVRELATGRRVVLTGTPLENRLSELWSIMDFCNPGLLGGPNEFRREFSVPVERYRDAEKSRQLRSMVRPFILRRLKTDPTVISDLPGKVETKEFCRLTPEQAQLYEACVKGMLTEVEAAEGIKRRGIVLTTLIRLKQICNHPAQVLKDDLEDNADESAPPETPKLEKGSPSRPEVVTPPHASRSGKCIRLIEMLDEVLASGEQALVFTQFRRMGELLAGMLRHAFGRDVLLLHGGTPATQRQTMIDRFQKGDGTAPIFILSLKAGGVGLNLTAASHVFHFDRWWNPAVENQATDRAFRIGQTKTVQVHKFIVGGTLEDRIDQMIESKIALAEDVIGAGEDWLTELSTQQLREMLALRPEAVGDDQ